MDYRSDFRTIQAEIDTETILEESRRAFKISGLRDGDGTATRALLWLAGTFRRQ